jgi:hypothetical protein
MATGSVLESANLPAKSLTGKGLKWINHFILGPTLA